MPCARMPSSFVTRKRIGDTPATSVGEARRDEHRHQLLEIALERLQGFRGEGAAREGLEVSSLPVLVDLLARAFDRVLLDVEQMLHEHDELDLAPLIHTIARAVLRGIEKAELALP